MPSELIRILKDIEHHANLVQQFIQGLNLESFSDDPKTIYAVVRCLEIISEASRRLPDDLKARHPSIPWKEIAGAGNVYRHDYEEVASDMVWNTISLALPPLSEVIKYEIDRNSQ